MAILPQPPTGVTTPPTPPTSTHSAEMAVTECPDCGETGRYDRRVLIGGRGIYTCPNRHQWQDADETPDDKGYAPLYPPGQSSSGGDA